MLWQSHDWGGADSDSEPGAKASRQAPRRARRDERFKQLAYESFPATEGSSVVVLFAPEQCRRMVAALAAIDGGGARPAAAGGDAKGSAWRSAEAVGGPGPAGEGPRAGGRARLAVSSSGVAGDSAHSGEYDSPRGCERAARDPAGPPPALEPPATPASAAEDFSSPLSAVPRRAPRSSGGSGGAADGARCRTGMTPGLLRGVGTGAQPQLSMGWGGRQGGQRRGLGLFGAVILVAGFGGTIRVFENMGIPEKVAREDMV